MLTLLAVFAMAMALMAPTTVAAEPDTSGLAVPADVVNDVNAAKVQTYIVQMLDNPVVAYEGGTGNLKATAPGANKKIDPNSKHVQDYVGYLESTHDAALNAVGGQKMYDYVYTYNGFAAQLTSTQVAALAERSDVLAVSADYLMQPDTISTPTFLGLDAEGGAWDIAGGVGNAGEDMIIGIVDTGIWPESASFSDRTGANANGKGDKLAYHQIPGWHGKCTPGEEFPASDCNQKLIGAQWFNSGYGGDAGVAALFPDDYVSARDGDGHGSHTASTAAGNYGVDAVVDGASLGTVSGMAPRARIAAYKVCWGGDDGGCFSSDSVAAIDQAVADGVDAINFSISGSRTSFLDPVEVAFLFAADAGIFVAASAGNEGPGASSVAHNSPWLTTVAAGTHDRYFEGTLTLGDGTEISGAMLADTIVSGDLVYSGDVALAGADPTEAELCYPGTLDPTFVTGNVVLCDRGVIARVDKSLAVSQAGGIGTILANVAPGSINADLHFTPTIHIDDVDGAVARAYAQTVGATATLDGGYPVVAEAPEVAAFSSRGPALASTDLLKPDIMAPGVDIIAAVAPPFNAGRSFDAYSGTSMASPHIAGLGTLVAQVHPDWSPMMVKSALMTTASQTTNESNSIAGSPFGYGAGQVVPTAALEPGLVYDAGWIDWLGFLCGTGQLQASYCPAIGIDPSDLNYPSITVGELAGFQTVTRTVTATSAGTYNVSVDAPTGVSVAVSPASLTLAEGESASYQVTFTTQSGATIGSYVFGSLTWSDGTRDVRSPLTVRPVQIAAPGELHGAGTDGSMSYDVTFGYTGTFNAVAQGLVAADMQPGNVVDDPANDINTALSTGVGVTFHLVRIPAGSEYARFSLFDDYTDGDDDLDLYVFDSGGSFVGGSGSGTSAEEVNVVAPADTFYIVAVHGWQTDGPDSNYTLFSWGFGPDAGNMTIAAPAAATLGSTESITVDWTGLSAGTKYLGAVGYDDGSVFESTIIRIDTD